MDERPVTRLATAPDGVRIAYQVIGDGPLDLLFPAAIGIPLDLFWDEPSFVRFAKRLGGFSRVLLVDYRGSGASGGNVRDRLVEEIADTDVTSVLDAVGCERVVIIGAGMSGPPAIRYAAADPERMKALILANTYAYYVREDDYPWGPPPEERETVGRRCGRDPGHRGKRRFGRAEQVGR